VSTLHIRWQRLVDEGGRTCERCGTTEAAVDEAAGQLSRSLGALGIDVAVEKRTLDGAAFRGDPLSSNRIWLGGEPLEAWLSADVGESACCGSCGDADCRTVTVDGTTYEAIPPELIVRAGLLAGARLLAGASAPAVASSGACCAPAEPSPRAGAGGCGCAPAGGGPATRCC
jgi:hypothetical protein